MVDLEAALFHESFRSLLKDRVDFSSEVNYLSPCGRGRPERAGEGYFRIALVLKKFQEALRTKLDGRQHADQEACDNHRTRVLEKNGFKVIRFWNNDMLSNLEGVLEMILNSPHPPLRGDLSHKGRGGRA